MRVEDVRKTLEPVAKRVGKPVSYCLGVYAILWQWSRLGERMNPVPRWLLDGVSNKERRETEDAFKEAGLIDGKGLVVDVFGWDKK